MGVESVDLVKAYSRASFQGGFATYCTFPVMAVLDVADGRISLPKSWLGNPV